MQRRRLRAAEALMGSGGAAVGRRGDCLLGPLLAPRRLHLAGIERDSEVVVATVGTVGVVDRAGAAIDEHRSVSHPPHPFHGLHIAAPALPAVGARVFRVDPGGKRRIR